MPRTKPAPIATPGEMPSKIPTETPNGTIEYEDGGGVSTLVFPQFQAPTRVRVMRMDDETKEWISHGIERCGDLTQEYVHGLHGGGYYLCQVLNDNKAIVKTARFRLPGPYIPPGSVPRATAAPAAPVVETAATPSHASAGMPTTMQMMEQMMASRFFEVMSERRNAPPPPSPFTPVLVALASSLGAALPALITKLTSSNSDPALLLELQKLQSSVEHLKAGEKQGGVEQLLTMLDLRDELKERLGGDKDASALGEIRDMVVTVFGEQRRQRGALPPAAPAAAAPTSHPPTSPDAAAANLPLHERFLKHYGRDFTKAAQKATDPYIVATVVLDNLPDTDRGILLSLVEREDAVAEIVRCLPETAPYEAWLREVVAEFRQAMGLDADPEDDDTPE